MQFHNLHVLVTCETQNFNDSCHFVWIFLFFVQIASEKAVDVTVSKTLQELHRGLSQKISTDSFLMLQPSPVGAANPGDAAPQAKTFSEAMEVLGAGAYPQYVRWILQISTNYKMNTYEYSWIQRILSAPVLFVLGLMHGSRRHPWNCQASTGLLAKDVVWEPSPASAKKTQSWHRQGGQNPVECAQKISMFGENGELPDVSSRKLSFLLPIHRQWRRPKKSWQILGQQVESQLVCHCSSLALVNPIHSAAMPPPVVCVGGGGDQECGRSIFSPINDEKMYFILLEEAIWLCLLYQQHDLGGCLSPRQKKTLQFPRDFKTNLPLWWAMSKWRHVFCTDAAWLRGDTFFLFVFVEQHLQWNDAEKWSWTWLNQEKSLNSPSAITDKEMHANHKVDIKKLTLDSRPLRWRSSRT